MKRVITLFAVLLMGWSVNAWSFACKTANGTAIEMDSLLAVAALMFM
ncbi:hypothetical protein EIMP300_84480 [Escherichia coli]|uniref:Fimbrial protein n=1 Tax=Escherichia coli TaxID=562 RepID=A0A8S0G5S8_ECOLX|nr:hypothetical protein EIMP300_84480 [Escherichia coli]